ncbi:hypothetical protein [Ideonella sp.]|uniref:hypothetical protein n=1 Tax=Ideonella sp. TaxID=1929293 RepID=UPI0035AE12A6
MWPHRPIGRALITLAIALVGGLALLLDAAAPPADGGLVAWHAVSMLVLAALALWALWAPQLPRSAGQVITGVLGLLLVGGLAVAARRLPVRDVAAIWTAMGSVLALAGTLFFVGTRWARREIRW